MVRKHTLAVAVVVGVLGLAATAQAQTVPTIRNAGQSPIKTNQQPAAPREVPPPALPGATTSIAPAEKTATDLPPTEALFDAINRGDIASARDALNRGADLGGHNVLGMTPLELSVDLSRNDITFLLLSLRAPDATGAPRAARAAAAASAARPGPKPAGHAVAVAAAATKPKPAAAVALPPARQYAGGGTPDPQAGFLGFGGAVQ